MTTEFIAPIFNFLVVAVVLWYYGRKPFAEFFVTRAQTIKTTIEEAQAQSKQAQALLAEWETKSKDREAHVRQLEADTKASIARVRESGLTAARAEAQRIEKEAKLVGQTESVRAKENLGRELAQKSVRLAGTYLGSHLDDKDRHKLVADYVESVGHGKA